MATTRNLGLVKAIFVGTTPPANTQVLWYDTSLAAPVHKYYDTLTTTWISIVTPPDTIDYYRLQQWTITGSTDITFTSALPSDQYYLKVLSYVATDGTHVNSGWDIPSANKTASGFRFIPPTRFATGTLWYEAVMYK